MMPEPLPQPAEPAEPAAPPDPFFEQVRLVVRQGPPYEWASLITIAIVVYATTSNATSMAAFAAVLALRDVSLLALMRATDTFDARLLYIPLGKGEMRVGTPPGREAVAILGGPAMLVLISIVAWVAARFVGPGIVKDVAISAVGLAAFTLLPLKPYDGFRLINLALFSRSARLEVAVVIITSLLLAGLGVLTKLWFLVFVALINIATSRRVLKVEQGAEAFRASGFASVSVTAELPEPVLKALYDATLAAFPDAMGPKQLPQARFCALLMREVHQRAGRVTPSVGVSVLLLTVYAALVLYFLIGLVVAAGLMQGDAAPPT